MVLNPTSARNSASSLENELTGLKLSVTGTKGNFFSTTLVPWKILSLPS